MYDEMALRRPFYYHIMIFVVLVTTRFTSFVVGFVCEVEDTPTRYWLWPITVGAETKFLEGLESKFTGFRIVRVLVRTIIDAMCLRHIFMCTKPSTK